MKQLFSVVLFVLVLFGLGFAQTDSSSHFRLITISGTGYTGGAGETDWNDLSTLDSARQRGVIQADTQVNLFGSTSYPRGTLNLGITNPKYQRSFVDGLSVLSKIESVFVWLSGVAGPHDFSRIVVVGHGNYEGSHSYVELNAGSNDLWDTTLARFLQPVQGYKIVSFGSCWADVGFAQALHAQLGDSLVVITAAGPGGHTPQITADDKDRLNGSVIVGSEQDSSAQYYPDPWSLHSEFMDKENKVLCGGVDPTWLRTPGGNAPGFWMDSIDLNHDGRISLAEESVFIRRFDSQIGWEDPQISDFTGLAKVLVVWPRHEIIDSLDAQPLELILPETLYSGRLSMFDVKVRARNNGIYPDSVSVELQIDTAHYFQVIPQAPPNYDTSTIFHNCEAPNLAWVQIRAISHLSGDQSPQNDTIVDSVFIAPTGLAENHTIHLNLDLPIPTVLSIASFNRIFAQNKKLVFFDVNGRRIQNHVGQGVIFLFDTDLKMTHKVIVTR